MDGSGGLRVAEFLERCADGDGLPSSEVSGGNLGLGSGTHHGAKNFAYDVEGAVRTGVDGRGKFWVSRAIGEVEETRPSTACFRFREVGCVGMRVELNF